METQRIQQGNRPLLPNETISFLGIRLRNVSKSDHRTGERKGMSSKGNK